MSEVECIEAVCNKIEANLIVYKHDQNFNNDNFLSQVINEINLDSLQIILQAVSKLFKCTIVLFYHKDQETEFNITDSTASDKVEAPLYILRLQNESVRTFHSMVFKRESVEKFVNPLKNYTGDINYDNIGRGHLPTPYSGQVQLHLRANKYHHSSIATHVTDLYNILKDQNGNSSVMVLADGGPDFTPASMVNTLYYYRLYKKLDLDFISVYD